MNNLGSFRLGLAVVAVASGLSAVPAAKEPSSPVPLYFDHEKVNAGFAKGGELLSGRALRSAYRVLTARRDAPGEVEIHKLDTDIFYVTSGEATFVVGGTPVGAASTAPDETRGASIQGGTAYHLNRGDVIMVPAGLPHWFKDVHPPFLYLVIKVR